MLTEWLGKMAENPAVQYHLKNVIISFGFFTILFSVSYLYCYFTWNFECGAIEFKYAVMMSLAFWVRGL